MGLIINGVDVGNSPASNTLYNNRSNYTLIQVLQAQINKFHGGTVVDVDTLSDLPEEVGGVITLLDRVTYLINTDIDLLGSRLVSGDTTVIAGRSSENCSITSTGLGVGVPLLTSSYTIVIKFITFKDVDTCLDFDGLGNTMALDWLGFNIENVPNIGTIKNFQNFIFEYGAIINSKGLVFDGTSDTVALNNSLLQGDGAVGTIISIASTAIVSRRFRITYGAIIAFGATVGIDFDVAAVIPIEGYILDTVAFSGGGTYQTGVTADSNLARFSSCTNINNTAVNGQLYMKGNATTTIVSATNTFYKVLGTTLPSVDNSKFLHSNNRLTCDAVVERKYLIQFTLSFTSGSNKVCEFGFYDSQLGDIRLPSRILSTSNTGGRVENISSMCIVSMTQGDYLEIHAANTTDTSNITVTDLNFIINEII